MEWLGATCAKVEFRNQKGTEVRPILLSSLPHQIAFKGSIDRIQQRAFLAHNIPNITVRGGPGRSIVVKEKLRAY
jgi:hypothetical protein